MAVIRLRALLVLPVLALLVGVVLALPDQGNDGQAVGTKDRARSLELRESAEPEATQPAPGGSPESLEAGPPSTRHSGPGSPTTTSPPAAQAHEAAPTTSTVPPVHTLVGRIAYIEAAQLPGKPSISQLWSMLPDGTDVRLETAQCPLDAMVWGANVDVSPDGTHIARDCGERPGDPAADGYGLVIQAVADGTSRTLTHHAWIGVTVPRWSPDGSTVAASSDGGVSIFDADGPGVRTIPAPNFGDQFTWSPDGTRLLSGTLQVLDLATGEVIDRGELFPAPPDGAKSDSLGAFWGPAGPIYLAGNYQLEVGGTQYGRLYRLDLSSGSVTELRPRAAGFMWIAAFLPDGHLLVRQDTATSHVLTADGVTVAVVDTPWPRSGFAAARPVS